MGFLQRIGVVHTRPPKVFCPLVSGNADSDVIRRLRVLEHDDLSPVERRLRKERRVSRLRIDSAIFEFRRYVGICLVGGPNSSYTMFSRDVDEVWHTLVLHTKLYREFCRDVLGWRLDHYPYDGPPAKPEQAWASFAGAYYRLYGELLKPQRQRQRGRLRRLRRMWKLRRLRELTSAPHRARRLRDSHRRCLSDDCHFELPAGPAGYAGHAGYCGLREIFWCHANCTSRIPPLPPRGWPVWLSPHTPMPPERLPARPTAGRVATKAGPYVNRRHFAHNRRGDHP